MRKVVYGLPRSTVETVLDSLSATDSLSMDVGGRGNSELRVIRLRTFESKMEKVTDIRNVSQVYAAMDVFSDGCAAYRPFVAALRCVLLPSPQNWLTFCLAALASHNASFHISEYLSMERFLLHDIIAVGLGDDAAKWKIRNQPVVIEFQNLKTVIFASSQSAGWKEVRSAIMEGFPTLTEIIVRAKL